MSMTTLTILRFTAIVLSYIFITILLPAFVLKDVLKNRRLTEKLMAYFLVGNFYIMNMVFVLELLHISYQWSLIVGTLIPVAVKIYLNRKHGRHIFVYRCITTCQRLYNGHTKLKVVFYKISKSLKESIKMYFKTLVAFLSTRWIDVSGEE